MKNELASPVQTSAILKKYGLRAKKRLGQNFLIDKNILHKIVDYANIGRDDFVLEIGPGIGTMTQLLAQKAAEVAAVEIDDRMVEVMKETLDGYQNVRVIHGDFLQLDLTELMRSYKKEGHRKYHIVGNLPYYISTPILWRLIENREQADTILIMLQKEVARRITAEPGGKEYGSLSIAVQYYMETEILEEISHNAFLPTPEVDSALMRLAPRKEPVVKVKDEKLFFELIRCSFAQRRKTIFNNLKNSRVLGDKDNWDIRMILTESNIDRQRRAETISIEEFGILADHAVDLLTN